MTVAKSASTIAVEPKKKGSSLQKALGRYKKDNNNTTKRKMTEASKQQYSSNNTYYSANGTETSGLVATSPRKYRDYYDNKNDDNSRTRTPTMKDEPGRQQYKRKRRPVKKRGGWNTNNDASFLKTNNNNRYDNGKETEQQMMKSTNYHFEITAATTGESSNNNYKNCDDNISNSKRPGEKSPTRQGRKSPTRQGTKSPTRYAGKSPMRQTTSKNKSSSSLRKVLGQDKGDPESTSEEAGRDSEQQEETTTIAPIAVSATVTETPGEKSSSGGKHKLDSKNSDEEKKKVESESNSEDKTSLDEGVEGEDVKYKIESSDDLNEVSDREGKGRDIIKEKNLELVTINDRISQIIKKETKQKMESSGHSNITDTTATTATTATKTSGDNGGVGVSSKIDGNYSSSKETKQRMELENSDEPVMEFILLVDAAVKEIFPCDDDDIVDSNVSDKRVSLSGEVDSVKDELDEHCKHNQLLVMKTNESNWPMNENDDDDPQQETQQQKQAPSLLQQDMIADIAPTATATVTTITVEADTNDNIFPSDLELKMGVLEEKISKMMKCQEEDQRVIHKFRMAQEAEQMDLRKLRLAQEEDQEIIRKLQVTQTEDHEIIDKLQNSVKSNEKQQVFMKNTFANLTKLFKRR